VAIAVACDGGGAPTPSPDASPRATPGSPECPPGLLASAADLTVYGADADDFLADRFSLAAGDFNGDGLEDILIGAPKADGTNNAAANAGEAYVILAAPDLEREIDLAQRNPDVLVLGESPGDNLGFTVAAGDLNGDGVDDVLVGARFASTPDKGGVGKGYVILGDQDLGGTIDTAAGDQDMTVIGEDPGDFLTFALASGDVDGDGVDDLLLGAAGAAGPDNDRPTAGAVYVVRGSKTLPRTMDLASQQADFTVHGALPDDTLPNYLAAGDLNGDGPDELVIGAPFADGASGQVDAGRAYLISIPSDSDTLDLAQDSGFATVIGAAQRDGLGFYVAAGDLNDDGKDDAVIGARDADGLQPNEPNVGRVHVLFGATVLQKTVDLAEGTADVTVFGADAGDSLGFTVATADLNGDGVQDLLAGAPIGDGCTNDAADSGEVYAIFGRAAWPGTLEIRTGVFDLSFFGEEQGDELGFSLAPADFNGDGKDDVLMGALLADGPDDSRENAGQVHLILSGR
jgi:hypothetical protein